MPRIRKSKLSALGKRGRIELTPRRDIQQGDHPGPGKGQAQGRRAPPQAQEGSQEGPHLEVEYVYLRGLAK